MKFVYEQIDRFSKNPNTYTSPEFRYTKGSSRNEKDVSKNLPPSLPNGFLIEHLLNKPLPGPPSEKSFKRLAQEFQVLIGAGSDQIALVLSCVLYYALTNREILSQAKKELDDAKIDGTELPGYRELEQLPYLVRLPGKSCSDSVGTHSVLTGGYDQ